MENLDDETLKFWKARLLDEKEKYNSLLTQIEDENSSEKKDDETKGD